MWLKLGVFVPASEKEWKVEARKWKVKQQSKPSLPAFVGRQVKNFIFRNFVAISLEKTRLYNITHRDSRSRSSFAMTPLILVSLN